METYDLPVGTGNRGARSDWNALPDRAAGQRKMIMRLDVGRKAVNTAACRCALVGNDGAARKIVGDDLSGCQRIERASGNIGLPGHADMRRLLRRFHSVCKSFHGDSAILVRVGEIEDFAVLGRAPGRL